MQDAWWWSYLLAVIGAFGVYLLGSKKWQGWVVGIGVQFLWLAYALVTEQYGFLLSCALFGTMNVRGLRRWMKDRRETEETHSA